MHLVRFRLRAAHPPRSRLRLGALLVAMWLLLLSGLAAAEDVTLRVVIEARSELKKLLEEQLDIVARAKAGSINVDEARRLSARAPEQIRNLLATEGYYAPKIDAELDDSSSPWVATFRIVEGEPTRVRDVSLRFEGEITDPSPEKVERIERVKASWPLKPGEIFKSEAWESAKRTTLKDLLAYRYPTARITESKASVDPEAGTADLMVALDSGPHFTVGTLEIRGLNRYPPELIERMNTIAPMSPYSAQQLLRLQQRLQATGYFSNVAVYIDPDPAHPYDTPIRVDVIERQTQRLAFGVGASSNNGARGEINYQNVDLFGRAWRFDTRLRIEQNTQSLFANLNFPFTEGGYSNGADASIKREDIQNQITTTYSFAAKRVHAQDFRESLTALQYQWQEVEVGGIGNTQNHALSLNRQVILRKVDNLVNPSRGYFLGLQLNAATKALFSDQNFLRGNVTGVYFYPFGARNENQLVVRGEIGVVLAPSTTGIPTDLLFRTGGDQTVRGYAYDSLGVKQGDAIVGGRYVLVASAEYIRWITPQWGGAVFFDTGNAWDDFPTITLVRGYGAGVRWRSPIGSLAADVAYGEANRDFRLHFAVGFRF